MRKVLFLDEYEIRNNIKDYYQVFRIEFDCDDELSIMGECNEYIISSKDVKDLPKNFCKDFCKKMNINVYDYDKIVIDLR